MRTFLDAQASDAGELCCQFQDWIDEVYDDGEDEFRPRVVLEITESTLAIMVGDDCIWDDQNSSSESFNLEGLKAEYRDRISRLAKFMNCESAP